MSYTITHNQRNPSKKLTPPSLGAHRRRMWRRCRRTRWTWSWWTRRTCWPGSSAASGPGTSRSKASGRCSGRHWQRRTGWRRWKRWVEEPIVIIIFILISKKRKKGKIHINWFCFSVEESSRKRLALTRSPICCSLSSYATPTISLIRYKREALDYGGFHVFIT